jgi:protein-S-isoprenylcysteine O-methyltransferase Ste14
MSENIEMTTHSSVEDTNHRSSEISRGVIRWLIREIVGVLFVAGILFIPAGGLDWAMGWALVGIYVAWITALAVVLIPGNPELLIERASRRKGTKTWDTLILSVIGLTTFSKYILAGFDHRLGWTAPIPLGLQITALVLAALGYALLTWSMVANAFFSTLVRIQENRGHAVATGGPYRYVRHPGYTGSFVFEMATPIVLGSLWALIPGGLTALLLVVRTALEDRTLRNELGGYPAYAERVRYRLLPGVW